MNNLSKNPAFMKRMESAVDFSTNGDSNAATISLWPVVVRLSLVALGAVCLYRLIDPKKIVINLYQLPKPITGEVPPVTESKNPTQNTAAQN